MNVCTQGLVQPRRGPTSSRFMIYGVVGRLDSTWHALPHFDKSG